MIKSIKRAIVKGLLTIKEGMSMFKNIITTLSFVLCFGIVPVTHTLYGYDEEEGIVGEALEFVSDMWQGLKKDTSEAWDSGKKKFKAASKAFLGRRRHNNFANYITYLKDEAKKAGSTFAQFVKENYKELKKELSEEEFNELVECSRHDEL